MRHSRILSIYTVLEDRYLGTSLLIQVYKGREVRYPRAKP